jgi:hypothetical protein
MPCCLALPPAAPLSRLPGLLSLPLPAAKPLRGLGSAGIARRSSTPPPLNKRRDAGFAHCKSWLCRSSCRSRPRARSRHSQILRLLEQLAARQLAPPRASVARARPRRCVSHRVPQHRAAHADARRCTELRRVGSMARGHLCCLALLCLAACQLLQGAAGGRWRCCLPASRCPRRLLRAARRADHRPAPPATRAAQHPRFPAQATRL